MPLKLKITKTHKERKTKNKVLVKSCLRQACWCFGALVAITLRLEKVQNQNKLCQIGDME